jgi:Tol biopolymer transport system component/DNA-binding winged helix-turn-helix (wHTH) protein
MPQPAGFPDPIVRFGVFELDRRAGELRKAGVRLSLQPQSFQVLSMLVARPGELVTRDELRRQLWPDNTFVDFQHGLNAVVNRLRDTLGDSAETPRFIETVPRRGYRFIGSVAGAPPMEAARAIGPQRTRRVMLSVAALGLTVIALAWSIVHVNQTRESQPFDVVPLTSDVGAEENPSFSPDGNQVAYSWNGEGQDNYDIYVKLIDAPKPLRLTNDLASDVRPVFSPDGRSIGFVRVAKNRWTYVVVPAIGGAERVLAELPQDVGNPVTTFGSTWSSAWLPDGKSIVLDGLRLLSVETGELRDLTDRHGGRVVGWYPAVAPDGGRLAFARPSGQAVSGLYVLVLSSGGQFLDDARSVSRIDGDVSGLTWTSDSSALVYSSGRLSGSSGLSKTLWRVPATPGARPQQLQLGEDATSPAIASSAARLAFVRNTLDVNIWRTTLPERAARAPAPSRFVSSTRSDWNPQYSPDGSRVAFESTRSGESAIWVAAADGTNVEKIFSRAGKHVGTPRWAPDSQRIAFDSTAEGNFDIYAIEPGGVRPVRLTTDAADDVMPSWSPDGTGIYFASNRTGRQEVWKVRPSGGPAEQVTRNGGACVYPSADGTHIYYTKHDGDAELWTVAVAGGEERKVLPSVINRAFVVVAGGVYFIPGPNSGAQFGVYYLDLSNGVVRLVTPIDGRPNLGLAISPDRQYILYTQSDYAGRDLVLVNRFR